MLSRLLLCIVDKALGIPSNFLVPSTEYINSTAADTMVQSRSSTDNRQGTDRAGEPSDAKLRVETPDLIVKKPLELAIDGSDSDEFKPSGRVYLAFVTLAVLILMVSLDGTIISVGLPVRQ